LFLQLVQASTLFSIKCGILRDRVVLNKFGNPFTFLLQHFSGKTRVVNRIANSLDYVLLMVKVVQRILSVGNQQVESISVLIPACRLTGSTFINNLVPRYYAGKCAHADVVFAGMWLTAYNYTYHLITLVPVNDTTKWPTKASRGASSEAHTMDQVIIVSVASRTMCY